MSRGVALLHELPPILKPKILFPWNNTPEETPHVLPAFLRLVQLFWTFDQSGIVDIILQSTEPIVPNFGHPLASDCLELLHPKLQESVTDDDWGSITDVQRADVFLTRQWMRTILWRAAFQFGVAGLAVDPIDVAEEFLSLVARLPAAALESHGTTLVGYFFLLSLASVTLRRSPMWFLDLLTTTDEGIQDIPNSHDRGRCYC